ncbi:MAG: 2-C-methyl-D-erythritol 4-phosphate cytidylyltransferase [Bacillota bacterium]
MTYSVIIVAAGEGKRAELGFNKVLFKIHNKPLIQYSLDFFNRDPRCTQIILVVNKKDETRIKSQYNDIVDTIVIGGELRQDSVQNGLEHVREETVLIHDGARPYLDIHMVNRLLETLKDVDAASVAVPIYDTVKRVQNDIFLETINRNELMLMQTPQGFITSVIKQAYENKGNKEYTCDITLVNDVLNIKTRVVLGHRKNIKATTKEDIDILEMMLT